MKTAVQRKFLEMDSIQNLSGVSSPHVTCKISLLDPPDFQLNKFFYKQIGKNCRWIDRLIWDDKTWIEYISNKKVRTHILKDKDELIGSSFSISNPNAKNSCGCGSSFST